MPSPARVFHLLVSGLLIFFGPPLAAQNPESGKDINEVCAACHGKLGEGGKKGEYPRLAGQRAAYIEEQLRSYRARRRINIPMFPYTQERELPEEDIRDIAAYLSSIKLSTKYPQFKDTDDAYTRLLAMQQVMIIPRVEGDTENGRVVYQKGCATCHGKTGMGRGKFPMLVGQYTSYLTRQMNAYLKGDRPHDEDGVTGVLNTLQEKDIRDILAYLTLIQERD